MKPAWRLCLTLGSRLSTTLIRTTLVVKYLDEVEILAESLVAPAHGIRATVEFEARDAGYYAAHVSYH